MLLGDAPRVSEAVAVVDGVSFGDGVGEFEAVREAEEPGDSVCVSVLVDDEVCVELEVSVCVPVDVRLLEGVAPVDSDGVSGAVNDGDEPGDSVGVTAGVDDALTWVCVGDAVSVAVALDDQDVDMEPVSDGAMVWLDVTVAVCEDDAPGEMVCVLVPVAVAVFVGVYVVEAVKEADVDGDVDDEDDVLADRDRDAEPVGLSVGQYVYGTG